MSSDLKQVILMRRDLKLRRAALAALTAKASAEFFIENDESERDEVLSVPLSREEVEWINNGCTRIVLGVSSESALRALVFKAEMTGIPCYPIMGRAGEGDEKSDSGEEMLCAALGPDDAARIDEITGSLKLL